MTKEETAAAAELPANGKVDNMAYYDYIRIYGGQESEQETFQGLGAAALYNDKVSQPQSGGDALTVTTGGGESVTPGGVTQPADAPTFPADLWRAQDNLLQQQNAYLDDIRDTFTQKRDEMGDAFDMREFTQSDTFKALVGAAVKKIIDIITDFIPGVIDDMIVDTIASYAPRAIGWGLVWLKTHLTAGAILCERMKEENIQLFTLDASFDNYRLRSQIIAQHDGSIQSLLSQVAQVETQLTKEMSQEALSEGTTEEHVIQCPHTGDYIYTKSLAKVSR